MVYKYFLILYLSFAKLRAFFSLLVSMGLCPPALLCYNISSPVSVIGQTEGMLHPSCRQGSRLVSSCLIKLQIFFHLYLSFAKQRASPFPPVDIGLCPSALLCYNITSPVSVAGKTEGILYPCCRDGSVAGCT